MAEVLKQNGHDIVYVGCGRTFSRGCVCMSAQHVGADSDEMERIAVCNTCIRYKSIIREQFELSGYDLDTVWSSSDPDQAERIVKSVTSKALLQLTFDGTEVGRADLSTLLLIHKRASHLDFTEDEWRILRIELGNTVRSFLACRKILDRERPDRVILYSLGYSVQPGVVPSGGAAQHSILLHECRGESNGSAAETGHCARPFAAAASPPILGSVSAYTLCSTHDGVFDRSLSRILRDDRSI